MYINGKKKTLEELNHFTYDLLDCLIDELYGILTTDGIDTIFPGDTLQQRKLIKKMIEHYIELEQYERCAVLDKIQVINQ
tara:strand:+ start:477 stop:716 length:240 start_codon:yes stop_codon:yes gene_type:complete